MPIRLLTILLMCYILSTPLFTAELPKTSPVVYTQWHFKMETPTSSEKHVVAVGSDELLHEVYISGDYAYVVRVIKASDTLLASTAVEKIIQEQVKSGAELGKTARWELDSQNKQLFKGFTRLAKVSEPVVEKLVGGNSCVQSIAMAPLGDESSPILAVGVMGREDLTSDVESLAKYIAFTVGILPSAPALAAPPEQVIVPREEPPLLSPNPEPSRSMYPKPARPALPATKIAPILKSGEIELAGAVESISEDRKSLVMSVESVTLPGSALRKLDSPRPKTVLLSKLPAGVVVGKRIVVIGKNKGVGAPIKADVIRFAEAAP
ncbi:MAG: hypothetical protein ACYC64_05625 [Armatimonadota bacterium]